MRGARRRPLPPRLPLELAATAPHGARGRRPLELANSMLAAARGVCGLRGTPLPLLDLELAARRSRGPIPVGAAGRAGGGGTSMASSGEAAAQAGQAARGAGRGGYGHGRA